MEEAKEGDDNGEAEDESVEVGDMDGVDAGMLEFELEGGVVGSVVEEWLGVAGDGSWCTMGMERVVHWERVVGVVDGTVVS